MSKEVIDETEKSQGIGLEFLNDSNPAAARVGSTGTGKGASSSNTKKEAVQLPRFVSDEKGG